MGERTDRMEFGDSQHKESLPERVARYDKQAL